MLWGTTVTFVLAALYLLGRLARGRAQRGSRLALGPFMLLGCLTLTTLLLVA